MADKKQTNMLDPAGEVEIARDLLMHRVEQRTSMLRQQQRPFTIRVTSVLRWMLTPAASASRESANVSS